MTRTRTPQGAARAVRQGGPRGRGARIRHSVGPGQWEVRARIERFVEPALLLLLAERPMHGYELLELLPEIAREERRVDLGNLYRLLRSLEEEGIVDSEWDESLRRPGQAHLPADRLRSRAAGAVGRRPRRAPATSSPRSSTATTREGVST